MNKYYTKEELNIKIPDKSIYEYLAEKAFNYSEGYAYNYFNKKYTYKNLMDYIELCAKSLKSIGIKENDVVTICMPNTPEAIISILAVNKIGAVADLIHPLSSEEEIKNYINRDKSKLLIAINVCFSKIKNIKDDINVKEIVIVNASDSMPLLLNLGYNLTEKRKTVEKGNFYMFWKDFLTLGNKYSGKTFVKRGKDDFACLLHSGGTTGTPKGIMLSNRAFLAISIQGVSAFPKLEYQDTILCILPIFHSFGLIVCIYAPLTYGMTCQLVPQFDAKRFDKLLSKYQPNVMAGVPTLFEALLKNEHMKNVDLSNIKYLISGGDTLNPKRNKVVNEFLQKHGCSVPVTQGYGMTETCGPITFGANGSGKLGSCGVAMPGNDIKIIDPETKKVLKTGETGEIVAYSEALMMGYFEDVKATDEAIMKIGGKKYIKTGDLGYLDEDGVLYYSGRIKRIIISSGYNVYPQYVEEVMMSNKYIKECCVIGKPHAYKKEIPILYVVLDPKYELNYTIKKNIMDYAKQHLAHYMIPKDYIYREELPHTLIGKVDYNKLKEELNNK